MQKSITRQRFVFVALSVLLKFSTAFSQDLVVDSELFFTKLYAFHSGEFPIEPWASNESRPQGSEAVRDSDRLFDAINKLDAERMSKVEQAYLTRFQFIDGFSKEPIDSLLKGHDALLAAFKNCEFNDKASTNFYGRLSGTETSRIKAVTQLVSLKAIDFASKGNYNESSVMLAKAFDFADALDNSETHRGCLLANATRKFLLGCFVSLQGLGTPLMLNQIESLASELDSNLMYEKALWRTISDELPILKAKERSQLVWHEDIRATMTSLKIPKAQIDEAIAKDNVVLVCETLQLMVAADCEKAGLDSPLWTHLKLARKQPRFQQGVDVKIGVWAKTFQKYVHETFVESLKKSKKNLHETIRQLAAIKCLEVIRAESLSQGGWISKIDDSIQRKLPIDTVTGKAFDVKVDAHAPGFCFYTIVLAAEPNGEKRREVHAMSQGKIL